MELRHLRYFVAIAEEGSFTRAADRLWIAQPGLSAQIRRLETELGVQLLRRHSRGVSLTEAGELFLERAVVVLAAAERAEAIGSDFVNGAVGSIRLGLTTGARWARAGELLRLFARRRPAVEVTVLESQGGAVIRDLQDGRLDAVIAPATFAAPDLDSVSVGREPWMVILSRWHRLSQLDGVTAEELETETVVLTGQRDGAGYDRAVREALSEMAIVPGFAACGPGPALMTEVAAGGAIALSTAPGDLGGELMTRPLKPTRTLAFELLWRSGTPSPALNELIGVSQHMGVPARVRPAPRLSAVA
jgi:DNA-binding transcriptional LysR family regulator